MKLSELKVTVGSLVRSEHLGSPLLVVARECEILYLHLGSLALHTAEEWEGYGAGECEIVGDDRDLCWSV